ncbi:MAG TPA: response regulator [Opitutaceae bacterium]|jgi:two-component system chemotaxis response regulator CheY|nr:response regulator [Opitutaceae bacterium]
MSKVILTVDDAPTMRKVVSLALGGLGHQLIEAEDGMAALELIKLRNVDLIISDVNMPRMDGIEFTRQARQLPNFARTPILLLTTESDPTIKDRGRAAGATGWIVKPFKQEQLVAVVAKVLPA